MTTKHPRYVFGLNTGAIKAGVLITKIERVHDVRWGLICRDEAHEKKMYAHSRNYRPQCDIRYHVLLNAD